MKNRSLVVIGIVTAVTAVSVAGASMANAHSNSGGDLVDKIANTYNLDRGDVQGTFSEFREEMQADHQSEQTERLQGLVDEGTITQQQADALIAKRAELKDNMEALRNQDLSRSEMHDQMESYRDDLKDWAQQQGIDLESIRSEAGGMERGGMENNRPRGMFGH